MGVIIHEVRLTGAFWTYSFVIAALLFFAAGVLIPDQPLFAQLMMFGSGILFILIVPDIRAFYGTEGIKLTFGLKGMWKARIRLGDITKISIIEFNPMKDFGGWGIKGGRGRFKNTLQWAMPSTGKRGILVETAKGKSYLIGDTEPETTLTILSSMYPVEST